MHFKRVKICIISSPNTQHIAMSRKDCIVGPLVIPSPAVEINKRSAYKKIDEQVKHTPAVQPQGHYCYVTGYYSLYEPTLKTV